MIPNQNLPQQTHNFKQFLIGKLIHCVIYGIVFQAAIVILYILFTNINLYSPKTWIHSVAANCLSVSSIPIIVTFSWIMLVQCLICFKQYMVTRSYCRTKFQQIFQLFSLHNILLLFLHLGISLVLIVKMVVDDSDEGYLTISCKKFKKCFIQARLFLLIGGLWIGLYFFLKMHLSINQIIFPIIQQKKSLQFRNNLYLLLRESLTKSVRPVFYYIIIYYFCGNWLQNNFLSIFSIDTVINDTSYLNYLQLWVFSSLYYFIMNSMNLFFYIYLTEWIQFVQLQSNGEMLSLNDALLINNIPILQHLASLDLFLLSEWSVSRRQFYYSLSHPGEHPHNWNNLLKNILFLIEDYMELLKKSNETSTTDKYSEPKKDISPTIAQTYVSPEKFRNLRGPPEEYLTDQIVYQSQNAFSNFFEHIRNKMEKYLHYIFGSVKDFLNFNFYFEELPDINTQKCLSDGQLIIWLVQGISNLTTASLTEDKFGIVQKDIPVIVATLVALKQNLDKLHKVPFLNKSMASDNSIFKMKNAITAAVNHSLFNICLHFHKYFKHFSINQDVMHYLKANAMLPNL